MMSFLMATGLTILGIIIVIGIVRVCIEPFHGFLNLMAQLMLLDWLFDSLGWVIENVVELLSDD